MRRFASVFAPKRDKQDSSPSPNTPKHPRTSTTFTPLSQTRSSLKRAHTFASSPSVPPDTPTSSLTSHPSTSQLTNDPALSSTSSNDSTSLRTPDDDGQSRPFPKKSKSWISWLSRKSSGTIRQSRRPDDWGPQTWHPAQPPIIRAPPFGTLTTQPTDDTDEDTSSESNDEQQGPPSLSHPTSAPPLNAAAISQSRETLKILIQNSLVPPLSPSPFVEHPRCPLFPRSSNLSQSLPPQESMRIMMHKSHMLRRLKNPTLSLTAAEQFSLSPFGSRPTPTAVVSSPPSIDEQAVSATTKVVSSSPGLRRWMERPCFEDRISVWVPNTNSVSCLPVAGNSAFAVAALEFSEALEVMAGFNADLEFHVTYVDRPGDGPDTQEASEIPKMEMPSPPSLSPPVVAKNPPYTALPSPLRNQHNPASTSPPSSTGGDGAADDRTITAKRGVRFVEEDKEDLIPIGYVLRMKKRRAEKARFLREEQERRIFEEERAKLEEERRSREKERMEWEKERRAWEKEKKAIEEERKLRLYAEEVAAARLRRESQRAGIIPGSSAKEGSGGSLQMAPSSFREPERNRAGESMRYSRPLYDSAQIPRRASEHSIPITTAVPLNTSHTPSPGSSGPPSIVGQSPVSSGSGRSSLLAHSRPPSVHSTHTMSSCEDARSRESQMVTKRNSMVSLSSARSASDLRSFSYPATWSASNQNFLIPPVPPVPPVLPFMMDMPLLPPTPPFMLQEYPRRRSQNSGLPNPSPSPQRLPSNSRSSERVNLQHHRPSSSRHHSHSTSSSSPRRSTHQRRSSDESRRSTPPHSSQTTMAANRRQPVPHLQPSPLSRGRPPLPASMSLQTVPSPWSAPPTKDGQLPTAMPTYSNMNAGSSAKSSTRRREMTIS